MSAPHNVLTKKIHDVGVLHFLDAAYVLWVSADEVVQLLRLPANIVNGIHARHKKCWNDFRGGGGGGSRLDGTRVFVDLYGLGYLCNRINSTLADYLCTLFVAEVYRDACCPQPPPAPFPDYNAPSPDCRPPPQPPCKPNDSELLDRIVRQNDLILNGLNQLCLNHSNHHFELSNILNSIKLQNVNIINQLSQIFEDGVLSGLDDKLSRLISDLDGHFADFGNALNAALAQVQDSLRNDLTNINSILTNLTSSLTNINSTINNLLQTLTNLGLGEVSAKLNGVQSTVDRILGVLTPEIVAAAAAAAAKRAH
ncbi:PP34 [Lymantria xylina nucleopolyhedrovirus]|uniref:PP34 n=1 Tax=Lymantria xylina multiple nucleopolyhedrovirus TaxID=2847840 RepID=D4N2F7_9ABAC|nr:PP34 [Lymantria xylina nucleopolyhedrovirus]ADD73829.1 PP34 [Lymantria xylina nucleopolyhedrovirus]